MKARRHLLRSASVIMITLGSGHLVLLALFSWADAVDWVRRGIWAAVPLELGGDVERSPAFLQNEVTFWAGPGSFAVPLILLGCLIWHLAGRGDAVPAWLGWGLAIWCLIGGVLLVPSPYFAGVVAGAFVIAAARIDKRTTRGRAASTAASTRAD